MRIFQLCFVCSVLFLTHVVIFLRSHIPTMGKTHSRLALAARQPSHDSRGYSDRDRRDRYHDLDHKREHELPRGEYRGQDRRVERKRERPVDVRRERDVRERSVLLGAPLIASELLRTTGPMRKGRLATIESVEGSRWNEASIPVTLPVAAIAGGKM